MQAPWLLPELRRASHGRTAALLADEVLPALPLRQWVVSFPFALRFLFAAHPEALAKALEVIYRLIGTHLAHKAGFTRKEMATGAVTLVQRLYRIAVGPQVGRKALVLRTIRPLAGEEPELIERVLAHVRGKAEASTGSLGPPSTGAPVSA